MNTKSPTLFIGMLLIAAGAYFSPAKVEAKSVVWSVDGMLNNAWDYCQANTSSNISVTYQAQVVDVSTGQPLPDMGVIPVGTTIRSEAIPHQNQDISWFQAGTSADSPYGFWLPGATMPSTSDWTTITNGYCWYSDATDSVIVLSVNPPTKSFFHSGSAGLSCDASGAICSVTSPGTIQVSVVFNSTNGRFFEDGIDNAGQIGAFYMFNSNFVVPAQIIPFSLSAVANNNPPAIPTVSCPPTAFVNTNINCSAVSIDSDGDTIRYDYDWDNDGSVDQSAPSSGYVPSNTLQALVHSYITASSKTINVRAVDSNGGVSGWGSAVTVVNNPVKTVSLIPSTSTITLGQSVPFSSTASFSDGSMVQHNLNWRKQGGPWNWDPSYVPVATVTTSDYTFSPTGLHDITTTVTPTQTGVYDVYSAASSDGVIWVSSPVAIITVNAPTPAPNFIFSATTPVASNGTSLISWYSVTNATGCTPSGGSSGWSGVSTPATGGAWTTGALAASGSPYTYYLTCTGAGGPTLKSATVIVAPASVCNNNNMCNAGETPLNCPQDCKVKFKTF